MEQIMSSDALQALFAVSIRLNTRHATQAQSSFIPGNFIADWQALY